MNRVFNKPQHQRWVGGQPCSAVFTAVSTPLPLSKNGSIVFASETFKFDGVAKSSTNVNFPSALVSTWAGERFSANFTVELGTGNV